MPFKTLFPDTSVPDSPDKLFLDLPLRKHPSLFDHQGQMLRTYAREAENDADVAFQLPTGSGKTLVGLLLAEWRRRKNEERVVYLCPTRQLVNQVVEEATTKYGLTVEAFTGPIKSYSAPAKAAYSGAKRVAVTTYNSLFNTNPYFNDPDVIIVDDAHAAESYIASQWTLRISRFEHDDAVLFAAVAGVLKPILSSTNYNRLTGAWEDLADKLWVDKIPTKQFVEVQDELRAVINENIGDNEAKYPWLMLSDRLHGCQLYVSSSEVLIRPLIPPTWTHAPFNGAVQRVYMSATLGAGGDLERLTGRPKIKRLAIPEGWDRQGIGRRFFIFPGKSLADEEMLQLRRSLMRKARRSLVLAPNNESADKIRKDVAANLRYPTFSADDLEGTKAPFNQSEKAVAIVANRYDGIDFPDDDCRLLFIEGLPRAANLQERFLMTRMGAQLLFSERVRTRVLQAVGRCTRGLNDYSAVVVTGGELPDYLTNHKRRGYFHPEFQAELEFGIVQSTDANEAAIMDNFRIFLDHGSEWEEANRQILEYRAKASQKPYPAMDQLAQAVPFEIAYQALMWQGDYCAAFEKAREV
jgi:Rad3-related DNA helicase